ncbi:hypothetical protein BOTBODRAFT_182023 [Botryobasidium botryosum FD-172 SS1]|uniref:Zn(2)-C6 fungal-type domain-containing protein n=1 Tax=Botryobasidium botryosum (strain FD-172 SS1) TaxID=930990 RepID=A0A067LRX6_BOTB1|nr:hypothetical protein BOTBODRAFT_182023 [Botryobasidium botryosum FD-172 SS1]
MSMLDNVLRLRPPNDASAPELEVWRGTVRHQIGPALISLLDDLDDAEGEVDAALNARPGDRTYYTGEGHFEIPAEHKEKVLELIEKLALATLSLRRGWIPHPASLPARAGSPVYVSSGAASERVDSPIPHPTSLPARAGSPTYVSSGTASEPPYVRSSTSPERAESPSAPPGTHPGPRPAPSPEFPGCAACTYKGINCHYPTGPKNRCAYCIVKKCRCERPEYVSPPPTATLEEVLPQVEAATKHVLCALEEASAAYNACRDEDLGKAVTFLRRVADSLANAVPGELPPP